MMAAGSASHEIYLDHAASTPLAPSVLELMTELLVSSYANPSSIHAAGRRARRVLEEARESVAKAINARPKEIVFTSGATESDNLALRGLCSGKESALLTSPLEHTAVRSVASQLERQGRRVIMVRPNEDGEIDLGSLKRSLHDNVGLVALMLVNNETGVRTAVEDMAPLVRDAGALFFCDAVQAFGFEPLDVEALGVDALALSAHKAYGPKGAGALWVREGLELQPIVFGGEQERGHRPGTHNTVAIAGFGESARLASAQAHSHGEQVRRLRDRFESLIAGHPGVKVNGANVKRGPKHSSVTVEGVDGEAMLMGLDASGIRASAGSACSAGSTQPSRVLTAMGLTPAQAKSTIRFSFGRAVADESEAETAAKRFLGVIERCRTIANV